MNIFINLHSFCVLPVSAPSPSFAVPGRATGKHCKKNLMITPSINQLFHSNIHHINFILEQAVWLGLQLGSSLVRLHARNAILSPRVELAQKGIFSYIVLQPQCGHVFCVVFCLPSSGASLIISPSPRQCVGRHTWGYLLRRWSAMNVRSQRAWATTCCINVRQ